MDGQLEHLLISIDFKPESLRSGPRRLRQVLENECVRRCWLKSLGCVDSKENLFCQLANVLIGAVGYDQNGLAGSPAKRTLADFIAALMAVATSKETTRPQSNTSTSGASGRERTGSITPTRTRAGAGTHSGAHASTTAGFETTIAARRLVVAPTRSQRAQNLF